MVKAKERDFVAQSGYFALGTWLPPGPRGGDHRQAQVTLEIKTDKVTCFRYGRERALILRIPAELDQLLLNRKGATALGKALIALAKGVE